MAELRVAVIGGGLGGLTTALALRATGAHVDVFEQARQVSEVGAGIGLHKNSQRVLRRLGLGDRVDRIASQINGFRLADPDGAAVFSETFSPDAPILAVHRADLITVLADALPAGTVHAGYRCTQLVEHNDHAAVEFDNGEVVTADAVVAADGIHSTMQRYVVEPTEPVFSGTVAYRGLIPANRLPDWPQSLVVWGGSGRHLLAFPVRRGQLINFVGFVPADEQMRESWSAAGDSSALADEFADWNPQARRLLEHVETPFRWGLYDREPLSRWTAGRLALLGDAAHPMLPHMGQGANQAIEDAMALATLVRGASADDVPSALVDYEMLRRDRTARIQQLSRTNGIAFDAGTTARLTWPWVQGYDVEAHARALSGERG